MASRAPIRLRRRRAVFAASRRGRGGGLLAGAFCGLAFAAGEALTRYREALAGTELAFDPLLPAAAALAYLVIGAAAGALHPVLPPLALGLAWWGTPGGEVRDLAVLAGAALLGTAAARFPRTAFAACLAFGAGALALAPRPPAPPEPPAAAARGEAARPDVLLVVLDTVRASSTSLHGAPRETTPVLSRLAREGVWFRNAVAPAPWTVPSHGTLFTGRPPREIGCHHESPSLAPEVTTLAERFADAGYRTGAFVANPWVGRFNGLTQGFAHQELAWEHARAARAFLALRLLALLPGGPPPDKGGRHLVERALAWWKPGERAPAFVFVNLLEAHSPFHQVPGAGRYGVPEPARAGERTHRLKTRGPRSVPDYPQPGELEDVRSLYDAGIRYVDAQVGRLVEGLREAGRLDDTLVVVTSDHGEAFGEHGFHGHMVGLRPETLHVPLVLRFPRAVPPGTRMERVVDLGELHDAILAISGVSGAEPGILDADAPGVAVSEQRRPLQVMADFRDGGGLPPELDRRALRVRRGDLVLLRQRPAQGGPARWRFYDLARDPGETRDLWPDPRAAPLRAALESFDARAVAGREAPRGSPDLRARLRALGYVAGP